MTTKLERAAMQQALEALEMAVSETLDYIQKNHLCGAENNHWIVQSKKAITALREALAESEALDHIADSDKMVTTSKVTLPKQGKCECGDKCFPIFSGNREYCETCGWPIVSGEDHNPNKVDEKALLEALAKPDIEEMTLTQIAARHEQAEPSQLADASLEPVAWRVRGYNQFKTGNPAPWRYVDGTDKPTVNKPDCCDFEPLYAAPVRTKDLTDDEINELWLTHGQGQMMYIHEKFARAVIAAYREKNNVK